MSDTRSATAPLLRLLAGTVKLSRAKLQRALEEHGVHAGQEYLLEVLWEDDGLSVGEIAARLGTEVPTVVRTAQRMEAAGIVTREPDRNDRRRSLIVLTERGRELQPVVLDALRSVSSTATNGLSDEERAQLIDLLTRVRRSLLAD
jgi:DNA-binding MarR family transcriptional regulator